MAFIDFDFKKCFYNVNNRNVHIISVYADNIDPQVAEYQHKVFNHFSIEHKQVMTSDYANYLSVHNDSIDSYIEQHINSDMEYLIIMDIDAIPLNADIIPALLGNVYNHNCLAGIAQQSNHINNDHVYVGPCGMALSIPLFQKLGSPTAASNNRGDTFEELTWLAEELDVDIAIIWPTHVVDPIWKLGTDKVFGLGTTYGDSIYHVFNIHSRPECVRMFVDKCKEVIGEQD